MTAQNPQHAHYEAIHDEYAAHYYDGPSLEYRRQHILSPLLGGADLAGKRLADIACGDGHNSLLVREMFPNVELHGFDISERACSSYRALTGGPATTVDLLKDSPGGSFDAALIVGGLHHCVADLDAALRNVAGMLKPGGMLYAVEPNARFFLNAVRMFWYRRSHYFEDSTEAPLDARDLQKRSHPFMEMEWSRSFGGPAYIFVLNSLLFGFSPATKSIMARPLMALDAVYDRLPGTLLFPAFMARFRRTAHAGS